MREEQVEGLAPPRRRPCPPPSRRRSECRSRWGGTARAATARAPRRGSRIATPRITISAERGHVGERATRARGGRRSAPWCQTTARAIQPRGEGEEHQGERGPTAPPDTPRGDPHVCPGRVDHVRATERLELGYGSSGVEVTPGCRLNMCRSACLLIARSPHRLDFSSSAGDLRSSLPTQGSRLRR